MSISQILQPNQYTIHGNLNPTQSGTIEDEGRLIFQFAGTTLPIYETRRYYYSVVGNCVTFQALIEIQNKGNGAGSLKWDLPEAFPQGAAIGGEPKQQLGLSIFGQADPLKFKTLYAFIDTGKEISLRGRRANDGIDENISDNDINVASTIIIFGSYFTL